MPESLTFAAPLPAFVFQNVAFEACVKLVDENKVIVTGVSKELAVTVRFHDSYDIVPDQSDVIDVVQRATIDSASGLCRFGVVLKTLTASNDARPFCIEVRSADGAVESVFSTPLTVVKEKLRIVQQPPDVWFKDEGGREKCMTVSLVLEPAPGAVVEDRVIPLEIRLLYESGNLVLNQSILRLFPDMRPNMSRGRVTVSFRIDDVSKNHQGQSFILEVAPEKQESSLMFQDIASARTAVIAIRSKRNKRKLAGGASGVPGVGGMRASPRSVAGTPRANLMMLHQPSAMAPNNPMMMVGQSADPSPVQRQRRVLHGTPTNNQFAMMTGHHPSSARGDMTMAQQPTATWSNHLQHHQQQQQQMGTPMHHAPVSTPMHAQTPMSSPAAASAAATAAAVEWKLAGFEINHSDGSQNVSRPIYRCPHCKRLNDVEMMSNGLAEHSPQCVFSSLLYRSQLEGAAAAAAQQQQQQQQQQLQQQQLQQQIQQMNHQHYLATHGTPRAYHQPQQQSAAMAMSRTAAHSAAMAPLDVTTTDIHATYQVDNDDDPTADSADHSPKTLAALMGSGSGSNHRPVLTISPFMNKVTTGSDDGAGSHHSGSDTSPAGNLFASNAFRNQMEISEVTSHLGGPDKAASFFEEKPEPEEPHDPADDDSLDTNQQLSMEDNSVTLSVGVGTALFNEMSSMGISLDQFDKPVSDGAGGGGSFNPLADFAEMGDEDQVFYILARMYTDVQNRKLGLPAFDQFQRMLGFYTESQTDVQTQVLFHALEDVGLPDKEQVDITNRFTLELQQHSDAVHSLPKYQHNLIMLREDALMYYWSQSIQSFGVN